jgi:hypothetical protein
MLHSPFARLSLALGFLTLAPGLWAAVVPIVQRSDAPSNEQIAARELAGVLGQLHTRDRFPLATNLPAAGRAILLGQASDALVRAHLGAGLPSAPESFVVRTRKAGRLELGLIVGSDSRGTVFGVYQLLGKLGCGFTLSGDALPAPKKSDFGFTGWNLTNAPLTPERLVFNWHNFLSGCSTWNPADWQRWTAQSQKMGYNAIMVHAYGNNPMAGFDFQGQAKPVGYLSTTVRGRDWSTMHVTDVRRLFGGHVFDAPSFGADAGLVPEDQRVRAAQALMQVVFADAARRGMGVYFAVDVDTPSANPQELVRLLPESARFSASGATSTVSGRSPERLWLPNPDAPEGHAFYRAQVETLVKTYPQITRLVVWFRRDGTPWMNLEATDLPPAWQQEFAAEIARTPQAAQYWRAPALFAIGKITRSFERALMECGASGTRLAAGTWGFEFLSGADRFLPPDVPLIGLDYDVIHEKPQLGTAAARAPLREVGAHRPVIPVVWAHHDDGHYIGRPYTPLPDFASKLADANAAGFGIIHWTTRPLDLYFSSLANQVWRGTRDQPLAETCREFAAPAFGQANRETMGAYLQAWITGAPRFGRDTSDFFIDRRLTNITAVVAGCRTRLALLDQARTSGLLPAQRQRLDYQRGLEEFIAAFHEAHGFFQDAQDLLKKGDADGARSLLARYQPEPVIEQFARFSSQGGITRGEQGLVVSLNTRWLSHIVRLRQSLGLEPVRLNFAPTSHDLLAQARGTFTFHFGPDHELWECLGEAETGATLFTLPPAITPLKPADAPAAWTEVCRTGLQISQPYTLAVRPILSSGARARLATLPGGDYRLRLLLLDPQSTAPGQRVFTVKVGARPAELVDIFGRVGGANRILDLNFPVTLETAGAVDVTITPVQGQALLSGLVLEPTGR